MEKKEPVLVGKFNLEKLFVHLTWKWKERKSGKTTKRRTKLWFLLNFMRCVILNWNIVCFYFPFKINEYLHIQFAQDFFRFYLNSFISFLFVFFSWSFEHKHWFVLCITVERYDFQWTNARLRFHHGSEM